MGGRRQGCGRCVVGMSIVSDEWCIFLAPFKTDLPSPATDVVRIENYAKYSVTGLASIVMLLSLVFACWTWCNHEAKIVRRTQPEFLSIMCSGCFLSSSVPIIWALDSHESCRVAWLVYALGFSISIGALSAKTLKTFRLW